jgi:hypothetical protein
MRDAVCANPARVDLGQSFVWPRKAGRIRAEHGLL